MTSKRLHVYIGDRKQNAVFSWTDKIVKSEETLLGLQRGAQERSWESFSEC